jgi:hypothetical protein
MLKNQIAGKNNSWAIRWYASAFLADKLTLYPGRSLVHNTGNDDSGTHASGTAAYDTVLSDTLIELSALSPQASAEGRASFVAYFRAHKRGRLSRVGARLLGFLKRRAA